MTNKRTFVGPRSSSGRPRGRSDEAGFTLLEVMVSLILLAIVMIPVAQMFLSSLRVGSASAHRAEGLALAERDIEAMRAIPYAQLGFSATQSGFSSTFVDGSTTYNTAQVAAPQLSPAPQTVVLGGVSYTLYRFIYWVGADRANPANFPEAYKQTTMIVSWSDETNYHQVRQEGIIYPGGLGSYLGREGGGVTTTTAPAGSAFPATLSVAQDGRIPATVIDLSWALTSGADHWQVQYSTDAFMTSNVLANGVTTTSYRVSGLASSSVYQFRVGAFTASGAGPVWSNVVTQVTAPAIAGLSCAATTVAITPNTVARAVGLQVLQSDLRVSVITTGPCTTVSARYTPAASPLRVLLTPDASFTNWSGTLDGKTTNWGLGDHLITIWNEATTTTLNSTGGVTVTP